MEHITILFAGDFIFWEIVKLDIIYSVLVVLLFDIGFIYPDRVNIDCSENLVSALRRITWLKITTDFKKVDWAVILRLVRSIGL